MTTGPDHTVLVERSGDVTTITMSNPGRLNALSRRLAVRLVDALRAAEADGTRAIVLTGEGPSFCAGMDLKDTGDPGIETDGRLDPYRVLELLDVPTVAAIEGHCLGAGLEIAVACDLRVAAEDAKFGLPEVRRGIMPGGAMARVARVVGPGRGRQLILTGDPIDGVVAERWGLVNECVRNGKTLEVATAMAERIATAGPVAIRESRRLLRDGELLSIADASALEIERGLELLAGPEAQEGITAFRERRAPRF